MPQLDDKGLDLHLQIDPQTPERIETDPDKVRQILKNFLANAVKFTERGSVTLAARPAQAPYSVVLSVADTGIGIPRGKQEAIFEAFQQADGSTSRRYGGTGLGLTISRQLADLLGGEIRLRSEPGQGAEFALLLPAVCAREAALPVVVVQSTDEPVIEDEVPSTDRLAGRQLLLMEPDVHSQLRLSALVRAFGITLHLADDFDEAVETLEELDGVDFLLIDALMPQDSACDTIAKMRTLLGEDAPVIGLVPPGPEEGRDSCLQHGADDFIDLPCTARALADVLIRHLHTE
jgi:CheY-like chemotaxis protein